MNERLRDTIALLRTKLRELDDGPRIGEIRRGEKDAHCDVESWQDFLAECNGGRFGSIDLWSVEELPSYQNTTLPVDDSSSYFVVGQILYEPIVIDRRNSALHWFPVNAPHIRLGDSEHFLSHYVFGVGYADLVPDVEKEPWWRFLKSQEIM